MNGKLTFETELSYSSISSHHITTHISKPFFLLLVITIIIFVTGNIVYHMAMRAGRESLNGNVKILGSILACPYFLMPDKSLDMQGNEVYRLWINICPELESGLSAIDSPMINPLAEKAPSLSGLGCSRLFMAIAEKDVLVPREIMVRFVAGVKKSGWNGELEFFEVEGEEHCFFVEDPEAEKAKDLIKRFASFIQHK